MILLDTHALIWLDAQPARMGRRARLACEHAQHASAIAVSAITFWEAGLLAGEGRLKPRYGTGDWRNAVLGAGVREWPIDGEIAQRATQLASLPGDPGDRFIVATALVHEATLVTADEKLLAWRGKLKRLDARR